MSISGFNERGKDATRLDTFIDAAFAFAVTILVISVDEIPQSHEELVTALKGIPAFLVAFALISIFWFGHHKWSRRFGLQDRVSNLLSFAVIFVVLVYVYPLKVIAMSMGHFFSGGALPSQYQIHTVQEISTLFIVYGIFYSVLCFLIAALNVRALSLKNELALSPFEVYQTRGEVGAWLIVGAPGLLSALIAAFAPPSLITMAGFVYMILMVVMPIYGWLGDKRCPPRDALTD